MGLPIISTLYYLEVYTKAPPISGNYHMSPLVPSKYVKVSYNVALLGFSGLIKGFSVKGFRVKGF